MLGIQQEAKQTSECARFPGTDLPAEIGRWSYNEERYVRAVVSNRNKRAARSSGMGERGGLLAALGPWWHRVGDVGGGRATFPAVTDSCGDEGKGSNAANMI